MTRLDYFAPGVYVEEADRGSRPIEGISMSVAGFVGFTEDIRGGAQRFQPMLVTNWNQYLEYFAKPGSSGFTEFNAYLPFTVRGWFDNGGGRCWVASLGTQIPPPEAQREDSDSNEMVASANGAPVLTHEITIPTVSGHPSLKVSLKPEQADLERLSIIVRADVPRAFTERPRGERSEEFSFDTEEFFRIDIMKGDRVLEGDYRHLSMDAEVRPAMGTFAGTALASSSLINLTFLAEEGSALWRKPANGVYESSVDYLPPLHLDRAIYGRRSDRAKNAW
jgi:uncharacterized protein